MLFKTRAYLTFLWHSTNQHGVHSPFVYQLVTLCFYAKQRSHLNADLRQLWKTQARYSNLQRGRHCSFRVLTLLHRLPAYLSYQHIVVPNSSHWTLPLFNLGASLRTSSEMIDGEQYDCIFIDSTLHTEASFKTLLLTLPKYIHNDTLVLMHPIHHTPHQEQLWNMIKSHPLTQVSIDTFALGFIFFRKEQAKEHFTIRL